MGDADEYLFWREEPFVITMVKLRYKNYDMDDHALTFLDKYFERFMNSS